MAMNGVLTLTVHKARNLKDTEIIAKMDPYAKLTLGREHFKTHHHQNGGRNPVWNHAMVFNVHNLAPEESIRVEVYDHDLMSDDLVGQGRWSLKQLLLPGPHPTWHQIYDKHNVRPCGEMEITAEFKGSNNPYQGQQQQQQQHYQPQVVQPQPVYVAPQPQVYVAPQPTYVAPVVQQVVQQHVSGGKHNTDGSGEYFIHSRTSGATGGQDQWKWCNKCSSLCYSGVNNGVCSAGGSHDFGGSGNYCLFQEKDNVPSTQPGWRWCSRCQVCYYAGTNQGACPATHGLHDPSGSGLYVMPHTTNPGPAQGGWKWCNKCMAIHYHSHNGRCLV